MAKLYEKISKRNKNSSNDQEFEVYTTDDFNDNKMRMYSQVPKIKKESEIISEIKKGTDYRTDDKTPVSVGVREGIEYIHSIKNGTTNDNILNLPTY